MIVYKGDWFGLRMLTRMHGSAILKSVTPATFSTAIMLAIYYAKDLPLDSLDNWGLVDHPYVFGVIVSAFTFLLTFRANFSYNRYWEAAGAVHQMHSKWMDVGIFLAAFHLQSAKYDHIRPPSFGKRPKIESVSMLRSRTQPMTAEEMEALLDEHQDAAKSSLAKKVSLKKFPGFSFRTTRKTKPSNPKEMKKSGENNLTKSTSRKLRLSLHKRVGYSKENKVDRKPRLDGGIDDSKPSLFLQEATHLLSLLSAVAMSTLRNDIECVETPITKYTPGAPWPPVDPDAFSSQIRQQFDHKSRMATALKFLFGLTRTDKHRTMYNAARPFRVLGGVSDSEIQLLDAARGSSAKVALCAMWLQEFISREYMAGSTGGVAPPIISRLYQVISDGLLGYNQARKIAYIPFPFPHAQLTSLFILIMIIFLPVLFLNYLNNIVFGAFLNFFTVMCFVGLHEVALELENPFQNAPNDLPLNRFQAQLNEGLITMFCGFHPDAWWDLPQEELPTLATSGLEDIVEAHDDIQKN